MTFMEKNYYHYQNRKIKTDHSVDREKVGKIHHHAAILPKISHNDPKSMHRKLCDRCKLKL